jgi:hypothetical protein
MPRERVGSDRNHSNPDNCRFEKKSAAELEFSTQLPSDQWSPPGKCRSHCRSVISSNQFSGNPVYGGIDVQGALGSVSNHRAMTHPAAPGIASGTGIAFPSSSTVTGNTVEISPSASGR